tara:strand:- start:614 stop:1285 length:672 start_codon:yes stop_codon:yes gene_type:complete
MNNEKEIDENITHLNKEKILRENGNESDDKKSPQENLDKINHRDEVAYNKRQQKYDELTARRKKLYYMVMLFTVSFFILAFASYTNQGLYKIEPNTLTFINQSFNALVLLMIPFLLGSLGGFTRVLISGLKVYQSTTIIISSGLMAVFSWVSIKSGVLVSIIAPHLNKQGITMDKINSSNETEFYTMALVAIVVGMFSSNVYIYINQKVEHLTNGADNKGASK